MVTALMITSEYQYLWVAKHLEDLQWLLVVGCRSAYEDLPAGDGSKNSIIVWLGIWIEFHIVHPSWPTSEKKISANHENGNLLSLLLICEPLENLASWFWRSQRALLFDVVDWEEVIDTTSLATA